MQARFGISFVVAQISFNFLYIPSLDITHSPLMGPDVYVQFIR